MLAIEHCHIVINNNGYYLEEVENSNCNKKNCNVRLLKKILEVIRNNIPYSPPLPDAFSALSTALQNEKLYSLACQNKHWKKRPKNYPYKGKISREKKQAQLKKNEANSTFIQIERLVAPQRFLGQLPNEIIQHILEYLAIEDLQKVAFVNIDAFSHFSTLMLKKAGSYWRSQAYFIDPLHYFKSIQTSLNIFKSINLIPEKEKELREAMLNPTSREKSVALLAGEERLKIEQELYKLLLSPSKIYEFKNCTPEAVIKALINFGLDPNKQDEWGRTALHYAIWNNNYSAAETLLKLGADPNLVEEKEFSPTDLAVTHPQLLELLLLWGANPIGVKNSLLICSVLFNAPASAVVLLRNRSPANITDEYGCTALHHAVERGLLEIVTNLILYKANINARDKNGCTPIFKCPNNPEMALTLIHNKAEIHHINNEGDTPLHKAAAKGYCHVIRVLLDAGASPFTLNLQEQSPLHLAICSENPEAMLLVSKSMSAWMS